MLVVVHVFKTKWGAPSFRQRNGPDRKKESCITDSVLNLCKDRYLQSAPGCTGTPGPIPSKTGSLLPGLMDKAVVQNNRSHMSVCVREHAAVEDAPVKLLLEVLFEAAFTGLAVTWERQEIYPPTYCQNHNHCLDDETFEIFSYLCVRIECQGNNQTYLVKRLKHNRNSLICNYKFTRFRPLG